MPPSAGFPIPTRSGRRTNWSTAEPDVETPGKDATPTVGGGTAMDRVLDRHRRVGRWCRSPCSCRACPPEHRGLESAVADPPPRRDAHDVLLLGGVGVCTIVMGAGLAWLVSAYRFPGSRHPGMDADPPAGDADLHPRVPHARHARSRPARSRTGGGRRSVRAPGSPTSSRCGGRSRRSAWCSIRTSTCSPAPRSATRPPAPSSRHGRSGRARTRPPVASCSRSCARPSPRAAPS